MRVVPLLFASVLVPGLTGCGPLISTQLILSAQAELEGAATAQAAEYATYEWVSAEEYLEKAREEQGYADFGPSIDYAFKAGKLARQARERAMKERDRAKPPAVSPPALGPEGAAGEPRTPRVIIRKRGAGGTPEAPPGAGPTR